MGVSSPLNALQNSPVKPSGPGLLCVRSFLITVSISSGVVGLFRLSASSSLSFWMLYFSRICLFHLGFHISWHIVLCSNFLMFLCISVVSIVVSPLSFPIVFIWVLSLFFLMSLLKGLSILFIFSKNQLLDSLILRIVLLVFMSFNSALILVISFLVLALGCLCCCSSISCRCRVTLFI